MTKDDFLSEMMDETAKEPWEMSKEDFRRTSTDEWRKLINPVAKKIKDKSGDTAEKIVDYYIDKLNIKASSINQSVNYLSGGNQQKVIISKLLGANLDVLIFDDPTFGVDVKVKMNIHKIMNEIVDKGGSIILVSSDNAELIGMCDRIIILKNYIKLWNHY